MATTNKAREFFVNGHHCKVEYESREHYSGWLDGEKITSAHSIYHVREDLIESAKWMVEVEPDFWKVCRAVHNFLQDQHNRDGDYLWTYRDIVIEQVTPTKSVGPAYSALLELEHLGLVEQEDLVMELNVETMWRAVSDANPEYREVENPWTKYESK